MSNIRLTDKNTLSIYLVFVVLTLLGLFGYWYNQGIPHQVTPSLDLSKPLQCVSYTPFNKNQSPFDLPLSIDPQQIEVDLTLSAKRFSCVRTYSQKGLEALPEIAEKLQLKVLLGIWIGSDEENNQQEIKSGIKVANAYHKTVTSVIVGNEALLRKDISPASLVKLIQQVKSEITQNVTYADVWEFWLTNPEMAPAVDFITIHLLPYWEDSPRNVESALYHVFRVHAEFNRLYTPKPILIGEIGWPSQGRQREMAKADRVSETEFIRGFLAMANELGWRYNVIEAFDQPWKRVSEGTVGGYWGLYDADRHDKQILTGQVIEAPDWILWLSLALCFMLISLICTLPRNRLSAWLWPVLCLIAAVSMSQWLRDAIFNNDTPAMWFFTISTILLNLLFLASIGFQPLRQWGVSMPYGFATNKLTNQFLVMNIAAGLFFFVISILALLIAFDGRYRTFPTAGLFVIPLIIFCFPASLSLKVRMGFTVLIVIAASITGISNGLANSQSLVWVTLLLLSLASLWRNPESPLALQVDGIFKISRFATFMQEPHQANFGLGQLNKTHL